METNETKFPAKAGWLAGKANGKNWCRMGRIPKYGSNNDIFYFTHFSHTNFHYYEHLLFYPFIY